MSTDDNEHDVGNQITLVDYEKLYGIDKDLYAREIDRLYAEPHTARVIREASESADCSLQLELRRYDSLLQTSGRIITIDSILAAATTAAVNIVKSIPDVEVIGLNTTRVLVFVFVGLLLAILIALIAQFRFRIYAFGCPASILEQTALETIENDDQADKRRIMSMDKQYQEILIRNAKISRCVDMSMILTALVIITLLLTILYKGWRLLL